MLELVGTLEQRAQIMKLLFSTPYDVRMHLATLYSVALSDGRVCHAEESYWNHLVSQYETKLGYKINKDAIRDVATDNKNIASWTASLSSRPCSARFLVKELVELVWRDGHFMTGEYGQLVKISNNCGVSISELDGLLMGVKAKMEAEEVISQIVERGEKDLPLRRGASEKKNREHESEVKKAKKQLRMGTILLLVSIFAVFFFCTTVWLCIKLAALQQGKFQKDCHDRQLQVSNPIGANSERKN